MNRRQADLSRSRTIATVALLILCGLAALAMTQAQDAADDREATAYVEQQARGAAQLSDAGAAASVAVAHGHSGQP